MGKLRQALRADLQSEKAERQFGTGWISGVLALACALAGLVTVLCIRFPNLLTTPMLREQLDVGLVRLALHVVLILGFLLAVLNLALRRQKIMGFTAVDRHPDCDPARRFAGGEQRRARHRRLSRARLVPDEPRLPRHRLHSAGAGSSGG